MCGIIGILGKKNNVVPDVMQGLKLLEYRGYDSAGIAVLDENGSIQRLRASGKIAILEKRLEETPITGVTAIGHTRWATHGAATEANAHPHATEKVAAIHNGIIENYQDIKAELLELGHTFESQTDSEVAVRLLSQKLEEGLSPEEATLAVLKRLEGAYALVFLFAGHPDLLIGARHGSPLAVGFGDETVCLGSDAMAVGPLSKKICYLDDDDWIVVKGSEFYIKNLAGQKVTRKILNLDPIFRFNLGKSGFRHFMLKEMYEQPQVTGDTLKAILDPKVGRLTLPEDLPFSLQDAPRLNIVACGTSYYASMVGKYWLESLARMPVDIEVASEFRYRNPVLVEGGVSAFISQSGETADTLAALRHCKEKGQHILSIVNVKGSSIDRESDGKLHTMAGPEFGVASTKSFTAQLTLLASLAIDVASRRGFLSPTEENRLIRLLLETPAIMDEILNMRAEIEDIAKNVIAPSRNVLYLGRGLSFPLALEGALKLKELSYIHAEAYAAGEIKHGPIALVDEEVPVIILAPTDSLFSKTASNLEEVHARGGKVVFFGDAKGREKIKAPLAGSLVLPQVDPFITPLVYAIPVQLLAYEAAVFKGTDVDQPRNLAKSVTVE
ncbi:MAG: glutamine--fructose-6-phosphate transaminase (isomerizing) [Deltaproteobacteria bacterium]|jgi:glucosamine--fructose-6-phosphate aminotransferase (isomerizing)|nr:glutamine--fructose-6-phosphate transaminase (isomerizing) [Deltaproteobacteria bacterium]